MAQLGALQYDQPRDLAASQALSDAAAVAAQGAMGWREQQVEAALRPRTWRTDATQGEFSVRFVASLCKPEHTEYEHQIVRNQQRIRVRLEPDQAQIWLIPIVGILDGEVVRTAKKGPLTIGRAAHNNRLMAGLAPEQGTLFGRSAPDRNEWTYFVLLQEAPEDLTVHLVLPLLDAPSGRRLTTFRHDMTRHQVLWQRGVIQPTTPDRQFVGEPVVVERRSPTSSDVR